MRSFGGGTGSSEQPASPVVRALLGPTNTGKTHRAIERMLDFERGAIGLPLRLLAREVYDRVSARLGEQAVALITGEEKRVPARARYFICTVEAMPPQLDVDFLAIDEIQLIASPERGHVFCDRLLNWRGKRETWFLGSDAIEGLLREQLAQLQVSKLPRLSRLGHAGQQSLRTLPRRSAVVAFGMQQVYELADLLRVRRRGAAVVLGALSPRVRNAQVALYQAGEVDFLVATDAIGMGLNLDIDHVALASDVKYDGFETRGLEDTELAQLVGRAGRYLRDGTFGTLAPQPELPARTVERLSTHRFAAQRFAYYRNSQLDMTSLESLQAELARRPPHPSLKAAPDADDVRVLRALAARADVRVLATTPARVSAVWDVCRVPNYEKRMAEHQAERVWPLLQQLVEHGRLQSDYVHHHVRRLERYDGDIAALLDRLAAVRTWTYVAHQGSWLEDPTSWRERTRALEDRLSDVLHERLLERFVSARVSPRAVVRAEPSGAHHPFAKLADLDIYVDAEREASAQRSAYVERVVGAHFEAFTLTKTGEIHCDGERLAKLAPGQALLRPALKPCLPDWIEPGARSRIERRLAAHVKDLVAHLLAPLQLPATGRDSAPLRGVLYQLQQGLGTVQRRELEPQLNALAPADRAALRAAEIELGRHSVFARAMLDHQRLIARAALSGIWQRSAEARNALADLPLDSAAWFRSRSVPRDACLWSGFVPLGRHAIRCDVLELLLARTAAHPNDPEAAASEARTLFGCSEAEARALARELPRPRRRRRRRPPRQLALVR